MFTCKKCSIFKTGIREIYRYTWNIQIREMFIGISSHALESKKHAKHWRLFVQVRNFITFLTFRFSTRRERDTQFLLCWLLHLTQQRAVHHVDPTGLASPRLENQLASSRSKSQLTAFFQKSPKILSPSLLGMTSFTSPVSFPIRGFYYDICDCHILPARAWTPALNVCPYPYTKPNSSKPN